MRELITHILLALATLIPFIALLVLNRMVFTTIASKERLKNKRHVINFVGSLLSVAIWVMAAITALGTAGVNVGALLAGLGLTGFALGFALKDVLASTIAGFMILFFQPFKLKDRIKVLGEEGEVSDINMRYTTLKTKEEVHLIPNSKIISEKVSVIKKKK